MFHQKRKKGDKMKTNMLTKDNLWMSVLMLTVLFAACKKNGLPPVDRPKVEETEVVVGKTDIKFIKNILVI